MHTVDNLAYPRNYLTVTIGLQQAIDRRLSRAYRVNSRLLQKEGQDRVIAYLEKWIVSCGEEWPIATKSYTCTTVSRSLPL